MTRADVIAYARTLEFIPPCLHWGTCQACGTVVWWERDRYDDKPFYHKHEDGVMGRIVEAGHCVLTDLERDGRIKPIRADLPFTLPESP